MYFCYILHLFQARFIANILWHNLCYFAGRYCISLPGIFSSPRYRFCWLSVCTGTETSTGFSGWGRDGWCYTNELILLFFYFDSRDTWRM